MSAGAAILCGEYAGRNEQRKMESVFTVNATAAAAAGLIIGAVLLVLGSTGVTGFFTDDPQINTRFHENNYCNVVVWIDSYYVEYRRCCRDVDPVEAVCSADYEYVLIASVDSTQTAGIISQLEDLGVERKKILTVEIPEENREKLLENFLDVEAIREKACLV